MEYVIYWIISEDRRKTYVGFTDSIKRRVSEHRSKKVTTTRNFGHFDCFLLEKVDNKDLAIKREKYWKSAAGRRKLKKYFGKVVS